MEERFRPPRHPLAPRVLVVDDDVILGGALCQLLLQKGFDVVGMASNGPEGVSLSRGREPDVVLMDFRMPMMDGLEATSLIKAHAPMTQTVMFTAYDDETLNSGSLGDWRVLPAGQRLQPRPDRGRGQTARGPQAGVARARAT